MARPMKAIATIGGDVPADLLAASGRYVGPIGWNIDRETPIADQWIESRFAPWVHSIVEDWAAGAFDDLSQIIFSRGDDNAQRLYYYICELRARGLLGGPEPLIFDVARIARLTSLARTTVGVARLAEQLQVDTSALEAGIVATNAARTPPAEARRNRTCLLAGTPPPDDRLHRMIAAQDWQAEGDTLAQNWADQGPVVAEGSGDPVHAIAAQVYARMSGPRAFFDRAGGLVAEARACGATAVILWLIEEEEGLVWHVPAQRRALEAAGLPHLVLTRRDWAARDDVAGEIMAFLKGLER